MVQRPLRASSVQRSLRPSYVVSSSRPPSTAAIFSIISREITSKSVAPQTVHFTALLCVAVTPHARHIDTGPDFARSRATASASALVAVEALFGMNRSIASSIAALVITWANDTLAYFAGRFLGRHKLYPEVSPNKTWEGFFGGMVGSVVGMFIARAFFFPVFTVADCLVLGIVGGILGPIGDLCESMLKRAYGVKDSGRIIPGHGGILDRIDALLFNAPLVFGYVHFVRGLLT